MSEMFRMRGALYLEKQSSTLKNTDKKDLMQKSNKDSSEFFFQGILKYYLNLFIFGMAIFYFDPPAQLQTCKQKLHFIQKHYQGQTFLLCFYFPKKYLFCFSALCVSTDQPDLKKKKKPPVTSVYFSLPFLLHQQVSQFSIFK